MQEQIIKTLVLRVGASLQILSPVTGLKYRFEKNKPVDVAHETDVKYILDMYKGKIVITNDNTPYNPKLSVIDSAKCASFSELSLGDDDVDDSSDSGDKIVVNEDGTVQMGEKIIKDNSVESPSSKVAKGRKRSRGRSKE